MGLNSTLYTAVSGLNAASYGINISSNNLANANVKGYSRQQMSLVSAGYQNTGVGYIGMGVKVDNITRVKDHFIDAQIRDEMSKVNTSKAQLDSLDFVESIINEPSSFGISAQMTAMLNSFSELSADPSSIPKLESTSQKLQSFTQAVNDVSKGFKATLEDNTTQEAHYVNRVESIINEINDLNVTIPSLESNGTFPNDLLDKRDLLIDELSEYTSIEVTLNSDESVSISALTTSGNQEIVGGSAVAFSTIKDDLVEGKIKGLQDVNNKVQGYLDNLNDFVGVLASDMDSIQGNNGGGALFSYTAGDEGATLTVHSDILDGTRNINVGDPLLSGDGTNAALFAELRTGDMSNGNNAQAQYGQLLIKIGNNISDVKEQVEIRESVLNQLEVKKESISGVSIDEETVDLMTFQQSYEANAKVMNVVQEMIDTLLGLFR